MKTSTPRLTRQLPWLETLLILSIIALVLQIFSPDLIHWWQSPRPGSVGIDYLPSELFQENPSSCLAAAYVCYLPKHYAQVEAWPLVAYLHGSGQRGTDPQSLVDLGQFLSSPISSEIPAVVLLPQCRTQHSWQPQDVAGFVKYACHRYRIDRERIYLIGYSMGSYGTWSAAVAYPDLFTAIVPIASGGNTEQATTLVNIPTWAFHGASDKVVPAYQTTELVDAIRQAGGNPKLTVLPKAGHGISKQVCEMAELWQWLFEQSLEKRRVLPHLESVMDTENKN